MKRAVKAGLYPWLLRHFDACLYVGKRNREYLERYGVPADRLFFSPHCVDVHAFAAAADRVDRTAVRTAWGVPASNPIVLFAGKMKASKRPHELIRSIARLRKRGVPAFLVWAGDGLQRPALERECATLGVPSTFLGFQNQTELPLVYGAADVLALPSDSDETWGLVVNEAIACGTPCVVSDACGCAPDMVISGTTGEVFPVGDLDALADALARAIQIPRGSRAMSDLSKRHSTEAAAQGILKAAKSWGRSRFS
jgi:glycosyltransferase involved in cell wall biosynthesis